MISHICVCEYTEGLVCVCVCVDVCPDRTHCLMHLASAKPIMKRMQNHATNDYCLTYTCMSHMSSYIYIMCMPYNFLWKSEGIQDVMKFEVHFTIGGQQGEH